MKGADDRVGLVVRPTANGLPTVETGLLQR